MVTKLRSELSWCWLCITAGAVQIQRGQKVTWQDGGCSWNVICTGTEQGTELAETSRARVSEWDPARNTNLKIIKQLTSETSEHQHIESKNK